MPSFLSYAVAGPAVLLIVTYVLIITERINRAIVALLAAALAIGLGFLTQAEAVSAIDFNTLGLLAGMMIIVSVARKSGMFGAVAIFAIRISRGSPAGVLIALSVVTAVVSALLDNVTTVLLIVPVTFIACGELKMPAYPFLFAEILSSNIGGTATLIGDPPNILIGSAAGLSYNDFLFALAPAAILILGVQVLLFYFIWGRRMRADAADRERVMALRARDAINDRRLLLISILVITGVTIAFIVHHALHLEAATIALFGAAAILLLENLAHSRDKHHENVSAAFNDVEWITLFFFIGLFIIVGAVEHTGLLRLFADWMGRATGGDRTIAAAGVLWSSALISAVIDNIPFVATMIPVLKSLAPSMGGADAIRPLWWAMALGACLGGNGSLVGASANLAVAGLAEKSGVQFRFLPFLKLAMPMMLLSIAIAHLYLWWWFL